MVGGIAGDAACFYLVRLPFTTMLVFEQTCSVFLLFFLRAHKSFLCFGGLFLVVNVCLHNLFNIGTH